MNEPSLGALAEQLQADFAKDLSLDAQLRVERWIKMLAGDATSLPHTYPVPGSALATGVQVICYGSTLLILFKVPIAPDRCFVYVEDLEDLTELGVRSWANIIIAHFDEYTTGRFYDGDGSIVKIGCLEFLGPAISEGRG